MSIVVYSAIGFVAATLLAGSLKSYSRGELSSLGWLEGRYFIGSLIVILASAGGSALVVSVLGLPRFWFWVIALAIPLPAIVLAIIRSWQRR